MHVGVTLIAAARGAALLAERFDDDRPLDEAGWREVRRAAPALLPLGVAELRYCSPTPRSRATGDALGFAPLAQPALSDCDMGRWRGYTLAEVTAAEPGGVDAWLRDARRAPETATLGTSPAGGLRWFIVPSWRRRHGGLSAGRWSVVRRDSSAAPTAEFVALVAFSFSIVAMSISMWRRVAQARTAWQASWTATAWRSRSMYSTSSGGPSSLSCLAFMTSFQVMTSRSSRMA